MKIAPILLLGFASIVIGCKERKEVWPQERYTILPNHTIQLPPISHYSYSIEKGSSNYVAIYTFEELDLKYCYDCGYPFHAFEFDPTLATFSYNTTAELTNAKAIQGQTSSIFGPFAYQIRTGKITGQKTNFNTWLIQFDLPADSVTWYQGFKKTAIFVLQ